MVVIRAIVDIYACIGCGLCESLCPRIFKMDEEGKSETATDELKNEVLAEVKDAEEKCPVNAITVK